MLYVSTLKSRIKSLFITGCGNTLSPPGAPAASGCDKPCKGNTTEYCGGSNRRKLVPRAVVTCQNPCYALRLKTSKRLRCPLCCTTTFLRVDQAFDVIMLTRYLLQSTHIMRASLLRPLQHLNRAHLRQVAHSLVPPNRLQAVLYLLSMRQLASAAVLQVPAVVLQVLAAVLLESPLDGLTEHAT